MKPLAWGVGRATPRSCDSFSRPRVRRRGCLRIENELPRAIHEKLRDGQFVSTEVGCRPPFSVLFEDALNADLVKGDVASVARRLIGEDAGSDVALHQHMPERTKTYKFSVIFPE